MSEILLFIGTLLIAFQIAGKISFVSEIFVLPLVFPIDFLEEKKQQKIYTRGKFKDIMRTSTYNFLFFIYFIVSITVMIALLPVYFVYFFNYLHKYNINERFCLWTYEAWNTL